MSSTGTARPPSGPTTRAVAPAAISAGTLSAAGEALHRLPPSVARPRIWIEPISLAPSTMPGHAALKPSCSMISMPVTAAPRRKRPFSSAISRISAMFLMSTSTAGSTKSARIWINRSVPPASTFAAPPASASSRVAASSDAGAFIAHPIPPPRTLDRAGRDRERLAAVIYRAGRGEESAAQAKAAAARLEEGVCTFTLCSI